MSSVPNIDLFRFYSKSEYASDFMSGNIRMGWLNYYQNLENNVRQDSTEGTGMYTAVEENMATITVDKFGNHVKTTHSEGIMNFKTVSGNESYILCTTNPENSANIQQLRTRFSDDSAKNKLAECINIFDVEKFTNKVAKALSESRYKDAIMAIEWFKVEYTKNNPRVKKEPPINLNIFQKPAVKTVSTFIQRNNGKTFIPPEGITQHESFEKFKKEQLPENLWREKVEIKDYTCENEWRLVAHIRQSFLIDGASPIFLQGKDREKRLSNHIQVPVEQLKQLSHQSLEQYEKECPFWTNTITVSSRQAFDDCMELLR